MKTFTPPVNQFENDLYNFVDNSIISILDNFFKTFKDKNLTLNDEIYLYNNLEHTFSFRCYNEEPIKRFIVDYQERFPCFIYKLASVNHLNSSSLLIQTLEHYLNEDSFILINEFSQEILNYIVYDALSIKQLCIILPIYIDNVKEILDSDTFLYDDLNSVLNYLCIKHSRSKRIQPFILDIFSLLITQVNVAQYCLDEFFLSLKILIKLYPIFSKIDENYQVNLLAGIYWYKNDSHYEYLYKLVQKYIDKKDLDSYICLQNLKG